MAKVLVTPTSFLKPENSNARLFLERFTSDIVYCKSGKPLEGDELLSLLEGVDGYIAGLDYITSDIVKRIPPSLKVISRYGAGYDRVDLAACRERGVVVTNTPGANATAVCELAFGLILSAARNIPNLHQAVERGEWPRANGMELAGKTLGIVGLGAIGKKLALRASAFEMKVLAYDPWLDKDFADSHGIGICDLDGLIESSDVISLHVPMNEKTYHLINRERIQKMRDGAIIINTARGGLIDEMAAAEAVKSGKLRGLGIDAFETEPLIESPLKGLPGVIFTPHTGAHTAEAISGMGTMAVQNLIDVLSGNPCKFIVN
jgi:D-3-phosphoglycerate dehydrogenase